MTAVIHPTPRISYTEGMGASNSRKSKRNSSLKTENNYLKSELRLNDDQIKEYRSIFNEHSQNKKVVTRYEFRSVYQEMYTEGQAMDFADRVFDAFDKDKSETVDFIEFAAGLTMMDSEMLEQKISIAFHMYDEDGNNTLSKQEVCNMIQAYYKLLGYRGSKSPIQIANDLFNKMDLDRDNKVTFEEFAAMARKDPDVLDILNP